MIKTKLDKKVNLKKWVLIFLTVFISFLAITAVLFIINKDKISSQLLLITNKKMHGELQFNSISLNPFVQFPTISITIENILYYEEKSSLRDSLKQPFANIGYAHIGFDISELIKGKISVSKIIIDDGTFELIKYNDSTLNLTNAFKLYTTNNSDSINIINENKTQQDTIDKIDLSLTLDQIQFNNINVKYTDKINALTNTISIQHLTAYLKILNDSINASLKTSLKFNKLLINNSLSYYNIDVGIQSAISFNRNNKFLHIKKSNLKVEDAKIDLYGDILLGENKSAKLFFNGSNNDMNLFSIFLNKKGIENLKSGSIYLDGSIITDEKNGVPVFNCNFGIENVLVSMPNSQNTISNLYLKGSINSGTKADFSELSFKIDSIGGILPDGFINGKILFSNIKEPNLNYTLNLKSDVTGFETVFNIPKVESIKGSVEISSQFIGSLSNNLNIIHKEISNSTVTFDNFSLVITDIMNLDNINGNISGNIDAICIDNLYALIGNSDFLIDGEILHGSNLISDQGIEVEANLKISSHLLDLAEFLYFKDNVGEGFPYQITDLFIDVNAKTDKTKLVKSSPVPEILFEIKQLKANANKFLPPINISNGTFVLGGKNGDLLLTFDDFNIETTGGKLNANVVYHEPSNQDAYVEIESQIVDFNPIQFFTYKSDSGLNEMYASINTDANCKLSFTQDTNVIFSSVEFNTKNITYKTDSLSYKAKDLNITTDFVNYNTTTLKNPLATLSANMVIEVGKLEREKIKIDSLKFLVEAKDGTYNINSKSFKLSDKEGAGSIFITPFTKHMAFEINFEENNINAAKLLRKFTEDTIINGNFDLIIQLSSYGDSISQLISSLNGNLLLKGEDILYYGIDLDNLLPKIERSQHFNLVDLGAVMVAGPIGLLLSKGTTYTNIILTDKKSTTKIQQFISDLQIINGKIYINDVAFSSPKNRIAANGWINIASDSLNIDFAVIDAKGCSKMSQSITGSLTDHKISKLQIISSLLAPVTNLFENTGNTECEPFYTGKVKHPVKE